jgi:hypothetical protein
VARPQHAATGRGPGIITPGKHGGDEALVASRECDEFGSASWSESSEPASVDDFSRACARGLNVSMSVILRHGQ